MATAAPDVLAARGAVAVVDLEVRVVDAEEIVPIE
jgi:hypothetical protein